MGDVPATCGPRSSVSFFSLFLHSSPLSPPSLSFLSPFASPLSLFLVYDIQAQLGLGTVDSCLDVAVRARVDCLWRSGVVSDYRGGAVENHGGPAAVHVANCLLPTTQNENHRYTQTLAK